MKKSQPLSAIRRNSLARDEAARINELKREWDSSGKLLPTKLFRFRSVVDSLGIEKVSLSGFNSPEILISFPFHERMFLQICPRCGFDEKVVKPLLETGQVIPILIANYSHYKASVLREVLRYPHVSHPELWLFLQAAVGAEHELLCGGCLEKRFEKEVLKDFPKNDNHPVVFAAKRFHRNLFPYPDIDADLIEQFCSAVAKRDLKKVRLLEEMSCILRELRTAEVLGASPALDLKDYEAARRFGLKLTPSETAPSVEHLAADGLGITIPTGMSPEKYIEIVLPHKARLTRIVREIAEKSQTGSGKTSLTAMVSEIGAINEQIQRAQKTRRFAALQASAGLVSTSPFLVGSLLAAGGMGLCSSLLGCNPGISASLSGVAAATTGGAKLLTKVMKTKWDKRVVAYKDRVLQDLRQQMSGVLATSLHMDLRSVHVWQVRSDLEKARASKD